MHAPPAPAASLQGRPAHLTGRLNIPLHGAQAADGTPSSPAHQSVASPNWQRPAKRGRGSTEPAAVRHDARTSGPGIAAFGTPPIATDILSQQGLPSVARGTGNPHLQRLVGTSRPASAPGRTLPQLLLSGRKQVRHGRGLAILSWPICNRCTACLGTRGRPQDGPSAPSSFYFF